MARCISYLLLASLLATTAAANESVIHLKEIDGRPWLVRPDGQAFFAHGINHISGKHGESLESIAAASKQLGFNAYGYGCPNALKNDMPYLQGINHLVPMSHYRKAGGTFAFIDIFDPAEQQRIEREIRKLCEANRENPNLIGYCWTDLGAWSLENPAGENWVDFTRSLPEGSPGRNRYEAFLANWDSAEGEARDRAFLRIIAREYFRVLGEANRKYDPDHLIFGDRLIFPTAIPEVVEEMVPYVDSIAIQPNFQPGFPREKFDRVHELSGKPIIICDYAVRFQEAGKQIRGWRPEATAGLAGQRYADYIKEAFATNYVIAAFWCNPVNSKPEFGSSGIKQGLFDHGMTPREELNQAVRELNDFIQQNTPLSEAH